MNCKQDHSRIWWIDHQCWSLIPIQFVLLSTTVNKGDSLDKWFDFSWWSIRSFVLISSIAFVSTIQSGIKSARKFLSELLCSDHMIKLGKCRTTKIGLVEAISWVRLWSERRAMQFECDSSTKSRQCLLDFIHSFWSLHCYFNDMDLMESVPVSMNEIPLVSFDLVVSRIGLL